MANPEALAKANAAKDNPSIEEEDVITQQDLNVTVNVYVPGVTNYIPLMVADYLETTVNPTTISFDDILTQDLVVSFATALNTETLPTRMLTISDLPEVVINDDTTKFVYNRFERDERVSRTDPGTTNFNAQFESLDEQENIDRIASRYTAPARYVKIDFDFSAPTGLSFSEAGGVAANPISNFPLSAPLGSAQSLRSTISQIINSIDPSQILVEGGMYSFYYSGTELVDTALDEKFYSFLAYSMHFNDIINNNTGDHNSSVQDIIDRHITQLNDADVVPATDESLFKALATVLGQNGFNTRSNSKKMLDSVKTLTHNLVFHNLFFDSIARASSDMRTSVYEDEFRAYTQLTPKIYDNVISNISPNSLDQSEFETQIGSTHLYDYASLVDLHLPTTFDSTNVKPGVVHIGYLIQKTEIIGEKTRIMDPIIRSHECTNFIDTNVAYGASYVYRIRSLFLVEHDAVGESDQIMRASFVIGSQGTTKIIPCLENEAPKPPQSVKFRYDHKRKGLDINWEFPPNPQGDIKGFQVFRRKSINDPYTMIMEYDFDNSLIRTSRAEKATNTSYKELIDNNGKYYVLTNFLDEEFNKKSEFIYAIGCFDAHGLVSNLSAQFRVRYNNKKRKVDIQLVSRQKAARPYPNMFLEQDLMQDAIKVSGKNRATVYFDPEYYKVMRNIPGAPADEEPVSLKFMNTTGTDVITHKIHFVNTDLQKSQVLNIVIKDRSTLSDFGVPYLEPNNLSFTLKLDE